MDEITEAFKGKPIGENRARLLKGYAGLHFAQAGYEREKTLREKQISSESDFLEAQKESTIAKVEFEAITEELGFQNRLQFMEKQRALDAAARDVKEAEQSVKVAEGAVRAAEQDVKAAEQSLKSAEMEVLAVEGELKVARQNLEVVRSALRAVERKLHILGLSDDEIAGLRDNNTNEHADITRYVMRAPFEGVVVEKHIVLGEAMKDDVEAFVVADLSSVWVNISVYQKDLPVVRKSLPVFISAGHGVPDAKGTISWVSPRIDEKTRTALARVVLPNTDGHWRPGLFVTAKIAVSEVLVSLLVPKTAFQVVEDKLSVFVQDEDGFKPRPVTLGRSNDTHAEITSGLAPGQRYVMEGAFTLKAQLSKGAFGDGHAH
jgi:cobalt-zinc-cadmium efflux system membrane fusion protein